MRSARMFNVLVLGTGLLLGGMTPASAGLIDNLSEPVIEPKKDGSLNLHFQPNISGQLAVGFPSDADPRHGAARPNGFRIIDNTLLEFVFTPAAGRARDLRIRMGFSGNAIRAGLRRLGVRARHLRVLNYDSDGGRWIRARTLRRLRAGGAGVAGASTAPMPLVWAVTNQTSGLFAVAARVPEPATLLLGATGLVLVGRMRRTSAQS